MPPRARFDFGCKLEERDSAADLDLVSKLDFILVSSQRTYRLAGTAEATLSCPASASSARARLVKEGSGTAAEIFHSA
jgi:hypothetical protein